MKMALENGKQLSKPVAFGQDLSMRRGYQVF